MAANDLRSRRLALSWTVHELAYRAGIDPVTLALAESTATAIDTDILARVDHALFNGEQCARLRSAAGTARSARVLLCSEREAHLCPFDCSEYGPLLRRPAIVDAKCVECDRFTDGLVTMWRMKA